MPAGTLAIAIRDTSLFMFMLTADEVIYIYMPHVTTGHDAITTPSSWYSDPSLQMSVTKPATRNQNYPSPPRPPPHLCLYFRIIVGLPARQALAPATHHRIMVFDR
jgi:hypothetical protein